MTGLIERSLSAAAVICILILLRRLLLHRLPKFAFRAAWAVIILRLLLPFSVPVFSGDTPGKIFQVISFFTGDPQEADTKKTDESVTDGKAADEELVGAGLGSSSPDKWLDNFGSQGGDILSGGSDPGLESALAYGLRGSMEENMQPHSEENHSGKLDVDDPEVFRSEKNSANDADRSKQDKVLQMDGERTDGQQQNSGQTGVRQADGQNAAVLNGAALAFILRGVWLAGVLFLSFYFLLSHLRSRKFYATALPVEHLMQEVDIYLGKRDHHRRPKKLCRRITIKASDRIFAPVTYGILRPVILLPKTTNWENTAQLRMVLEHEAVHIRRFDVLYKWLLAAAAALHWFNPFVWAMYVLANRDIELSCDEAVIRRLEKDGKKDYALALLSYEEKRMFSPTVSGFGGNAVKERIEAIMKINKTSMIGMAMAVILVAGTTTVFAGAKEGKNAPVNEKREFSEDGKSASYGQNGKEQNPDNGNPDEQNLMEGNQKGENPDKQNLLEGNRKNENRNEQDSAGKTPSEIREGGSSDEKTSVKQYLCEPAYYTLEEFEEVMEIQRKEIRDEVAAGLMTQEFADEMLAMIEKKIEEVRNGRQVEKPSQVYYADGTPVVNSQGGFLYVKASDIERMNAELRAKAERVEEPESVSGDAVATQGEEEGKMITGSIWEDLPDYFVIPDADLNLSWYNYAEYKEYIEQQKKEYRQMKGEWGFNSMDGWYEWDDEKIEEACNLLDENLAFIENGGMISKPDVDGGTLMGGLMISSSTFRLGTEEGEAWSMSEDDAIKDDWKIREAEKISRESSTFDSEFLKAYETFGVTADKKDGVYLYQGRKVAGIRDGGLIMVDDAAKKENGIYLKGVRVKGELVGVEEVTEEEFNELVSRSAE